MRWDGAHYSGASKNLSIEARPGLLLRGLPAGGGVEHARVIYVEPGKLLRMQGALGPLQGSGVASVLTWAFEPGRRRRQDHVDGGDRRLSSGGFDKIAALVDGVLKGQVARLAKPTPLPRLRRGAGSVCCRPSGGWVTVTGR